MANWVEPIFDRTQADVDYAKQQLANGINNIEYKGCFNVSDGNRIENNTRYIADTLNDLYYPNNIVTKSNWTKTSYIYFAHIERIINNIEALLKAYHTPAEAEDLPSTLLNFEEVNTLEKNIYLIKEMLEDMISSFRECGTFNCGEE